jgi:two-component system CheB/CheR fusion protein
MPGPDSPRDPNELTVVAIGASAGGLDAFRRLVTALPPDGGMAYILVQHLDPNHESMIAELLAGRTTMAVRQAADGLPIERDRVYVIPPGAYLSVGGGALRLSQPEARRGDRLPFDFLLRSMARDYGSRAVCIVLSGTGADGSLGLSAVKAAGGLVIAQDPKEAAYDGMPRSAIATGDVDLVLGIAEMPAALEAHVRRAEPVLDPAAPRRDAQSAIVDLLRARTAHDFTLYKPGTLQRRIERRMALGGVEAMERYFEALRADPAELDRLAKDLLINVTSFFRDREVFELLAERIVPDLVADHAAEGPLRVWIAGCSTGEETYSLAILFRERIAVSQRNVKLQIFASDIDADAVARAREGLYPPTIAADVSPERVARFFSREERGYRVLPELRDSIVFTVQDLLADPPFSRLDMVSCRNLMIYLQPEAQAKALSVFHFALRQGGVLLLGGAEAVAADDPRFEPIAKSERLYRHVTRSRPGDIGFLLRPDGGARAPARARPAAAYSRQAALADLCRRLVLENYAPAAVLVDSELACLYSLGPTDRFLIVAPGQPTHDLLAMARPEIRTRLRSAIQQARQRNARVVVAGGEMSRAGDPVPFSIAAQPVVSDGEALLFICFSEESRPDPQLALPGPAQEGHRVAELERELAATRTELEGAIRNLEVASQEQRATNEEALSVTEEYQSANEELLTSKEELQSLNEELTALNGQLQETLERQRTTADDLQNVLYSTEVATICLDAELKIRFFTPAAKALFNVIPGDVGRPLADLRALAADDALLADAGEVLRNPAPVEREIAADNGVRYSRRISPYRTQDRAVAGVVITFADITERARASEALAAANRQALAANAAKAGFLAAASHDLRQPMQTLALLQGLLARKVRGERAQQLLARIDEAVGAMSGMLNTLLDMNQIEAGAIHAEMKIFPIDDILERLRGEFAYQAQAQGLALRVVRCGVKIESDPRLLERMLRNLLSNAMKYTRKGKVLLGCRRRGHRLSIEVWDTGAGIPGDELQHIFEEYHQLGNAAREQAHGLGLGLAVVQRLAKLLDHPVRVRSQSGRGSVFAIEVRAPTGRADSPGAPHRPAAAGGVEKIRRTGVVLVVEDDPEMRQLLEILLEDEGHHVEAAADGVAALALAEKGRVRPDLILADYNLPNGMDGLQIAAKLRERLQKPIPVIVLTGDISTATLSNIARHDCVQFAKPVKARELTEAVAQLLAAPPREPRARGASAGPANESAPVIFVVDDDSRIREGVRALLEEEGRIVEDYASGEAFLEAWRPGREACLLIDAGLPGMSGLDLLRRLRDAGGGPPAIMITGNSDVPMAVQAMKAGALDFIEKPIGAAELLASVARALEEARDSGTMSAWRETAAAHLAELTAREREIMDLVVAGHPSKNIAADLGISQRTVENHRAAIMKKTGSTSLPALARLALTAAWKRAGPPA